MTFAALQSLLRVPANPFEIPSAEDMEAAENRLGTLLPTDYKEFLSTYGSGRLCGFMAIYNPVAASPYSNLFANIVREQQSQQWTRENFPELPLLHPSFPERGGLLSLGHTDNGDYLYWLTQGFPNDWPVVIREGRGDTEEMVGGGIVELLECWITNRRRFELLPDVSAQVSFRPYGLPPR